MLSFEGAIVYVNDILIKVRDEWEHDENLKDVMIKLAQTGIHLMPTIFNSKGKGLAFGL